MEKVVAFGASNSSRSINRKLAQWASAQLKNAEVDLLDLNDFEMPIYSIDREQKEGIPEEAHHFKRILMESDGILISFAEYNGGFTAAFKNIQDWVSRIGRPLWSNKPMFILATSPGPRGAQRVLSIAQSTFPHQGGAIVASFSLPSFNQNFSSGQGILDAGLKIEFTKQLKNFERAIQNSEIET